MHKVLKASAKIAKRTGRQVWVTSRDGVWHPRFSVRAGCGYTLVARVIGDVVVKGC